MMRPLRVFDILPARLLHYCVPNAPT